MADLFAHLLAAGTLKTETVEISDRSVVVREMSTEELLRYQRTLKPGGTEAAALMLSMTVMDPDTGKPALTVEQAQQLMSGSAQVVTALTRVAMKLSGLIEDEEHEPEPAAETGEDEEPAEKKD